MDVADADAMMPSPPSPPSRFVLAPMRALARAAAKARPHLCTACALVLAAGLAAVVVARRVWGEGSAPPVFLEALTGAAHKACLCFIFLFFLRIALLLCRHGLDGLLFLAGIVFDLVLDFTESDAGQIILESIQESFSYPGAVFGGIAYVFCVLLTVVGYLVATMLSTVDGSISMGEKVGSMIMDVGTFGMYAVLFCLIFVPAFARRARREDQSDRRRTLSRES